MSLNDPLMFVNELSIEIIPTETCEDLILPLLKSTATSLKTSLCSEFARPIIKYYSLFIAG